jgi:predicted CXXCH cytochrome family protein
MSRLLKMPPQLVRLVLLTIGIVCVYFTARFFLTPTSFGQFGHYRADALREIASREPVLAGKAACVECHTDHAEKLAKGEHKTLSCETCHGPGREHVADWAKTLPKLNMSLCVRCHEASPSKPKWLHQINVHNHYTGNLCTECHVPHQPNEVP